MFFVASSAQDSCILGFIQEYHRHLAAYHRIFHYPCEASVRSAILNRYIFYSQWISSTCIRLLMPDIHYAPRLSWVSEVQSSVHTCHWLFSRSFRPSILWGQFYTDALYGCSYSDTHPWKSFSCRLWSCIHWQFEWHTYQGMATCFWPRVRL